MKDKFKKMVLAVAGYLVVKNILDPAAEGHRQKTENRLRAKNLRKDRTYKTATRCRCITTVGTWLMC